MKLTKIANPNDASNELFNLMADKCEFYKDQNSEVYMVYRNSNGYDLMYLGRENAKRFLRNLYFKSRNAIVGNSDVTLAHDTAYALAESSAGEIPVYTRVAYYDEKVYYDLANNAEHVVKISKNSVKIIAKKDIQGFFFYKDARMREQVLPQSGDYGVVDFTKDFLNISEGQHLLVVVYICTAMIQYISHPIFIAEGEKGAGKTHLLEILMKLINPVRKDVFILPKKLDNLIATLSNNHFNAFDNVGILTPSFSDALCQASTGGTLNKRKLYSDNEEISINIKRLVAMNGVNMGISQSDFLDRSILVKLDRISDDRRRTNEELNKSLERVLPFVLNDIFVIISKALELYNTIQLDKFPRMADFAKYGYAIAEAIKLGYGKEFLKQYDDNIQLAAESAVGENPLLECVRYIAEKKGKYQETMSKLLLDLKYVLPKVYIGRNIPDGFPVSANSLSRKLSTCKHELIAQGIKIEIGRSKTRYVTIEKLGAASDSNIDDTDDNDTDNTGTYLK